MGSRAPVVGSDWGTREERGAEARGGKWIGVAGREGW